MTSKQEINQFLRFMANATTQYHATAEIRKLLLDAGFKELQEKDKWNLKTRQSYFVVRNDSAIIAFKTGKKAGSESGFQIAGAHTDSPGLKIKSQPENKFKDMMNLAVAV